MSRNCSSTGSSAFSPVKTKVEIDESTSMFPSENVVQCLSIPHFHSNQTLALKPTLMTASATLPPVESFIAPFQHNLTVHLTLNREIARCITIGQEQNKSASSSTTIDAGASSSSVPTQSSSCLLNPSTAVSTTAPSQTFYPRLPRQRYHDHPNKSRFSATGAEGKCVVVRDRKISFSHSPSPTEGIFGGSYQNFFVPISVPQHTSPLVTNVFGYGSRQFKVEHPNPNEAIPTHPIASHSSTSKKSSDDDVIFVSMTPGPSAAAAASPPLPPKKLYCKLNNLNNSSVSTKLRNTKQPAVHGSFVVPSQTSYEKKPLKPFVIPQKDNEVATPREKASILLRKSAMHSAIHDIHALKDVSTSLQGAISNSPNNRKRKVKDSFPAPAAKITKQSPIEQVSQASALLSSSPAKSKFSFSDSSFCQSPPCGSTSGSLSLTMLERAVVHGLANMRRKKTSFSKRYKINGKIGSGGGGTVYSGTRKSDNLQVAIKRVVKEKVRRWGVLDGKAVPIEFQLLHMASSSGNENIIGMFEWFERAGSFILVMERPEPVIDLFDYLNEEGPLSEYRARKIFKQLVQAVMDIHAQGVIHRDIKDENVIINLHTMEVKIIDFGCGTKMQDGYLSEFAGTHEFYPPEWFEKGRYSGKRVDTWALGVVLFNLVEGRIPFQSQKEIMECKLPFKCLPVSNPCRVFIEWILQKNEYDRPSLYEISLHPWMMAENSDLCDLNASSSSIETVEAECTASSQSNFSTTFSSTTESSQHALAYSKSMACFSRIAAFISSSGKNATNSEASSSDVIASTPKKTPPKSGKSPLAAEYITPSPRSLFRHPLYSLMSPTNTKSPSSSPKSYFSRNPASISVKCSRALNFANISPTAKKVSRSPCCVRS